MAKTPTVEEAARRAEQALSQRVETVRALARARQALQDVADQGQRELDQLRQAIATRTRDAELADARAWTKALDAGWGADELRRVGFSEPQLKVRTGRARIAPPPTTRTTPHPTGDGASSPTGALPTTDVTPVAGSSTGTGTPAGAPALDAGPASPRS